MNFSGLSRLTRFATRACLLATLLLTGQAPAVASFEDIVRKAVRTNGFTPAEDTHVPVNPELVVQGKIFFESKHLSLNGNISCQSCHLDEFGSADGIPNAVAVGGEGKGAARAISNGGILPRNTLSFWGRGGADFSVFFWDGKVDFSEKQKISQFGDAFPSDDPLVTAVHLPPVEIREMLAEDKTVLSNKKESVQSARNIFRMITVKLKEKEPEAVSATARLQSVSPENVSYLHIATALASFIRDKFRLKETRFHRFVFKGATLTDKELRGAQLFYGKGRCSTCHSGPYLTDFKFHAVPFPQVGFGKNGFGVDYGRFNVTHDPADLYKFRTPPLFNVEKTAPYGHSGSVATMREAIVFHFDPLRGIDPARMHPLDRHEYFKRLAVSAEARVLTGFLDDEEVDSLVVFLKILTF